MRILVSACSALLLAACAAGGASPSRLPTATPPGPAEPSAPAPTSQVDDLPEITVQEATGIPSAGLTRRLASSRQALRRCLGTGGGKVTVRLTSQDGLRGVTVDPSGLIDLQARECVLDALTELEWEDTGANASLPRPSSFTSLISISW